MPWKFPTERTSRREVALLVRHGKRLAAHAARRQQARPAGAGEHSRRSICSVTERCAGNSFVRMSTSAPAKSPCWSGVKVLSVVTDCSKSRRKHVERDDALFRLGARDASAVERRDRVSLAEAAHRDVLVVLDRDAAHALNGLRRIARPGSADLLGGHRVDDADRGPLLIERFVHRSPLGGRRYHLCFDAGRGDGQVNVLLERLAAAEKQTGDRLRRIADASHLDRDRAGGDVR